MWSEVRRSRDVDVSFKWFTGHCQALVLWYIGVARHGALGYVPPSTSSNIFQLTLESHKVYSSPLYLDTYSFENVWNWQREAFYMTLQKALKSFSAGALSRAPLGVLTRYLGGRGGIPLSFFTQSTPFDVSVSATRFMLPRTKSWRHHCQLLCVQCDRQTDRSIR